LARVSESATANDAHSRIMSHNHMIYLGIWHDRNLL
jgi:hypothetical protein